MSKIKDWLSLKWSHLKDYAEPYTDKVKPAVDSVKEHAEPYVDQAKENIAPAIENAKTRGKEMIEKGKEKANEKVKAVKEAREAKKAAQKNPEDPKGPNKTLILIGALVLVLLVVVLVVTLTSSNNEDPTDATKPHQDNIQQEETVTVPTEPDVEDKGELKDDENRPTFTLNGIEYSFGCRLSTLLEKFEIENVETYLHYNKKALIIQPGKTREWTICDKDGNKCYVEVYNPTEEELSSEHCLVYSIMILSKDVGELEASFIGSKITSKMPAKEIVDTLGQVSGRDTGNDKKIHSYWWNWMPYQDNAEYVVYVKVETEPESGEIIKILVVDKTITKQ